MRRIQWMALGLTAALALPGCHNAGGGRRTLAANEPALAPSPDSGGTTITAAPTAPPAKSMAFVDRHPILSRPRDYYESSGDNKIVKTTAATVIGIPAGIFGELRQIVVGAPAEPRY